MQGALLLEVVNLELCQEINRVANICNESIISFSAL